MNNQCSLINKDNPCKCKKKTKALIEHGYVNPNNMMFDLGSHKTLKQKLQIKSDCLDQTMEKIYKQLYKIILFVKFNAW